MTLKILLIDDLRGFKVTPEGADVIIARNSTDALAKLTGEDYWDYVYLDHDLGWNALTNKDDTVGGIVDYLAEEAFQRNETGSPLRIGHVLIHTSNPVGAQMIQNTLDYYGYVTTRINASDVFTVEGLS